MGALALGVLAKGRPRHQAVNRPPHDGIAPRLGVGGSPFHHSSKFALCPRGCAGEERELPGRWRRRTAPAWVYHPPHAQAFPQRHSQPSPWGGPTGGGTALLSSGPSASSSARSPPTSSMPATGPAVPAVQPSMVVLTTADPPTSKLEPPPPPLFPLQNTTRRQRSRVESCIPLSTGVAWAAKPASNPAPPPTQVVNTTTHHMQLKLAQLAPPTLLTGPHIYKKSLTSRLCPCRVILFIHFNSRILRLLRPK